jgi:cell division protein FtsI/penicillin-binding protein 2
MNDHHQHQIKQRRKRPARKNRKSLFFLLLLLILLGSGTIYIKKDRLDGLVGFIKLFNQYSTQDAFATSPTKDTRGNIYDKNYRSLAVSYKTYAVYARPLEMIEQDSAAARLAEVLNLDENSLLASLKKEKSFVWLARGITQDLAATVKNLNLKGVYQNEETNRFYPNHQSGAHVIGFVENGQGLDGIEFHYNSLLRGDDIDIAKLQLVNTNNINRIGDEGAHLVLNLDLMIQSILERFLKKRLADTGATLGSAVLMNAANGAILAMANLPSYSPNRYWDFSSAVLKNHALAEPVYPGELNVIFHQAAAINLLNNEGTEQQDKSAEKPPLIIISPQKQKRFRLSSAPQADSVDPEYLLYFGRQLGFNQKITTDIPMPENLSVLTSYNLNDPASSTSALHLLRAFTALVNNGKLVSPHFLNIVHDKKSGFELQSAYGKQELSSFLHNATSQDLMKFLKVKWLKRSLKDNATGMPVFFESHRMASTLSATAEQAEIDKTGYESVARITQSVMLGAFPGEKPAMTMILLLNYPDSSEEIYPGMLDTAADMGSVLAPNNKTINKILHLASIAPPTPSSDFWESGGIKVGRHMTPKSAPPEKTAALKPTIKTMPDIVGKSLRGGLQVLQNYNLNIKLVGSGWIVSQDPPAGAVLRGNNECTLEMKREI